MRVFRCRWIVPLLLTVATAANAATITFAPPAQTTTLGGTASADLAIAGLGTGAAPSLGSFDLTVTYDSGILSLAGVTFGSFLGDEAALESVSGTTPDVGRVVLWQLSFLFDFELDALQPSAFTLATLTFDTLSAGVAELAFESVLLGDAFGPRLPLDTVGQGSITVLAGGAAPVPEPPAWWLWAALPLLILHRRRRAC